VENDQTLDADSVVEEWIDPYLPTVLARWHDFYEQCFASISACLIEDASISPGDAVIDIGSGSGIPALLIAQTVGLTGVVVATDPSPILITALEHNARHLGLTNLRAVRTNVTNLPERDGGYDAATCQMGVMFFPDVDAALRCVRQVLRPGGRVAFAVWGPIEENALFTAYGSAVGSYLPPAPELEGDRPEPIDAPGPARFAVHGTLSARFRDAGFVDVREAKVQTEFVWPGRAETIRDFYQEMMRLDEKVSTDRLAACRADLLASFERYADGDTIRLPAAYITVWGQA
jgi:ubiquinone/menaquinone biosynthesis C-methylase UbiE